ncbi:Csu type fimbrial protein [Xanthomonas cerealis]|uniref:Spore coat protein U domain-containing protein n=1 Tax=Xanthomonas cerealis pv. cerealis TaxID=152263 RepID=A0A514EAG0_9XANT|nr:hypothetical protein [Xanthomonas translucens]QDI02997.1 hypothetical protein E4A48_04185 [Xanthomonas translucens pv. cerealis]UKE48384.1 hypothetical protein KHA79_07175 [Xanthomonas translucens pv. cerealis]UKE70807.1 hypothetical protein K8O61_07260 [Xanthomonas translucens pv. pistacia]
MTARPFMQSLLLASFCAVCASAAAQIPGANENTAFRVGIRLLGSCEIDTAGRSQPGAAAAQVACSRPLPYQVSIDGAASPNAGALALSLSLASGVQRQDARYATVAF